MKKIFDKKTKIDRLRKRSDFLHVQKNGQKWISKSAIVEFLPSETSIRLGLTVSKRVSKLAVKRNRTKRRLREAAEIILQDYKKQSFDIVLVGRLSTDERDFETIQKDLRWCLSKLGVSPDKV